MPRCCDATSDDFAPCYASVLVVGSATDALRAAVERMEESSPISPCVTAWCSKCLRVATITSTRARFLAPSAHLAHSLVVHEMVERTLSKSQGPQ